MTIFSLSVDIVNRMEHEYLQIHSAWERYERAHYCGRIMALKQNIDSTINYLASFDLSESELDRATRYLNQQYSMWLSDDSLAQHKCSYYQGDISLYPQKSEKLPPLYPNWVYVVHLDSKEFTAP
jgi:hypothetical protein